MSKVKIGRPKGNAILDKPLILKTALMILDEKGSKGLSMRSLALRLGVTPMALYKYFADRSSLLRSVSDWVYSDVTKNYEDFSGSQKEKLEFLLLSYHKAVIDHPNLSISIFEDPDSFSLEVQKITDCLRALLAGTKLPKSKKEMWLDILIDFTHGSSIAIALNQLNNKSTGTLKQQSLRYQKEMRLLVNVFLG